MKTSRIHPSAYVAADVVIGAGCVIHPGARIGTLGLSLRRVGDHYERNESRGSVVIEDNVEVGANTVVHRGVEGDTVIGEGTFIGSMCNIGHDVRIGCHCRITPRVGVYGYVEIGDYVYIAPGCDILNRIRIGSRARIGIGSLVMRDIPKGVTVYGRPAAPK